MIGPTYIEEAARPAPHAIACMEVWGGNAVFDAEVSVPGNDVRVCCSPHVKSASGGDIYYVSNCAAGIITRFVLADVSGHGEHVSAIALELRSLMRRHINAVNPTRFAHALNRAFGKLDLGGRFATALLITYFAPTDHLIICNAGHPPPLWYRVATDSWHLLTLTTPRAITSTQSRPGPVGVANLPLGILDPLSYTQFAVHLDKGDFVVLYSDAFIEASGADGRQFGAEGLLRLASALTPTDREDAAAALKQRVLEASGVQELDDDATLIVLRHNAADPPRMSLLGHAHRIARSLGLGGSDTFPSQTS